VKTWLKEIIQAFIGHSSRSDVGIQTAVDLKSSYPLFGLKEINVGGGEISDYIHSEWKVERFHGNRTPHIRQIRGYISLCP
jgi:hypothetical protein